jgi:hypothetical protein
MTIRVVRTTIYQRVSRRILTLDEIVAAEAEIIAAPEAWPVIPGGGGIRKARIARGTKGKSGGARVIYFWMSSRGELYFLTAYAKNVQEDLSQKELRDWRDLIRSIKNR